MFSSELVFDAYFFQNILHQAPFGKCPLQEVGSEKSGKPQPILAYIYSKQDADEDKASGDCPYDPINHNLDCYIGELLDVYHCDMNVGCSILQLVERCCKIKKGFHIFGFGECIEKYGFGFVVFRGEPIAFD